MNSFAPPSRPIYSIKRTQTVSVWAIDDEDRVAVIVFPSYSTTRADISTGSCVDDEDHHIACCVIPEIRAIVLSGSTASKSAGALAVAESVLAGIVIFTICVLKSSVGRAIVVKLQVTDCVESCI